MIVRRLRSALQESAASLSDFDRWATLAWIDTSLRYRRTVLGPWWLTLSTGLLIGSVGFVWGAIFNVDVPHYMPYFAVGIILWTFLSGSVIEGCNVFSQSGSLIKSVPAPLVTHVYRMLARQLIVLAHNAVLIVLLWILIRWPIGWSVLLAVPALIIVTAAVMGAILALGILCTRFRDVPQIVSALLQLVFLLTPIIWTPESVRGKAVSVLLDLNPLYYLVTIVREPLLGHASELNEWLVAGGFSLASLLIGHLLYGRFSHRVAYWL